MKKQKIDSRVEKLVDRVFKKRYEKMKGLYAARRIPKQHHFTVDSFIKDK